MQQYIYIYISILSTTLKAKIFSQKYILYNNYYYGIRLNDKFFSAKNLLSFEIEAIKV